MILNNIPKDYYEKRSLEGNPEDFHYLTQQDLDNLDLILIHFYTFDKQVQRKLMELAMRIQYGQKRVLPATAAWLKELTELMEFRAYKLAQEKKARAILRGDTEAIA